MKSLKESRKPRILFLLQLPPPVHGSSIMSKQIKDSLFINNSFDCDYLNIVVSRKNNQIGNKISLVKYLRIIKIYLTLFLKLCKTNYDLCYFAITVTKGGLWKDVFGVLLCKFFRKKLVYHQHNKGVSAYQNKPVYDLLYKWLYSNAKVILLSKYLYPEIKKYVGEENVYICPNGISEMNIRVGRRKNNQILFLSNLIPSKGCLVLLDACRILKEKNIDFHCDIVGDETKMLTCNIFLEEIRKRNLTDCVSYHGPKYGQEKNVFFEKASIFVFPTYYYNEAFPLVILEAMQYELPVISTNEGGIPDIIEDGVTGYIVNRQNSEELAERIKELLLNSELREEMGKVAQQKFYNQYTVQHFEKRMFEILLSVLPNSVLPNL